MLLSPLLCRPTSVTWLLCGQTSQSSIIRSRTSPLPPISNASAEKVISCSSTTEASAVILSAVMLPSPVSVQSAPLKLTNPPPSTAPETSRTPSSVTFSSGRRRWSSKPVDCRLLRSSIRTAAPSQIFSAAFAPIVSLPTDSARLL